MRTFSLLIPRQENVLKGVGPPPVHFQKKMYWHKGGVFLLYFFFFWGGGFGLKKNVLKGVGPPWLHFFLLFSPPPPSGTHVGGSQVHFQPSPPHRKMYITFLEVSP